MPPLVVGGDNPALRFPAGGFPLDPCLPERRTKGRVYTTISKCALKDIERRTSSTQTSADREEGAAYDQRTESLSSVISIACRLPVGVNYSCLGLHCLYPVATVSWDEPGTRPVCPDIKLLCLFLLLSTRREAEKREDARVEREQKELESK